MTQIEAAISEYVKTISDLSARLGNYAIQNQALQDENQSLKKQLEDKKSEPIK